MGEVKSWGTGSRVAPVVVNLHNIDFALLASQKRVLVKIRAMLSQFKKSDWLKKMPSPGQAKADMEKITGLIHLLDRIQDESVKSLGEDVVYGSILRTMPMPAGPDDEANRRSMNKNTHGR